jgi:MarR family transcriptional regulator, 2-MHQ and catechol-resistance regulon repressor
MSTTQFPATTDDLPETREERGKPAQRAAEFYQAVSELVRAWQLRDRNRAGTHNLSSSAAYAIEVLVRMGAIGVNELAAELYVERSTASRIVAGLEEKGYVLRSLDPSDRRSVHIEVTELGRQVHRQLHEENLRAAAELLASTPAEERNALTEQLRELARTSAAAD